MFRKYEVHDGLYFFIVCNKNIFFSKSIIFPRSWPILNRGVKKGSK